MCCSQIVVVPVVDIQVQLPGDILVVAVLEDILVEVAPKMAGIQLHIQGEGKGILPEVEGTQLDRIAEVGRLY